MKFKVLSAIVGFPEGRTLPNSISLVWKSVRGYPLTPLKSKALRRQKRLMAIYHLSVKAISRADGRSAVASSAYRSGELLVDNRQGKEQDYTRKTGVEYKHIYAPINAKSELLERESLWNKVEQVENRKNSVLAREFEIAFPQELNAQQRQELLDEFCQMIVDRHNVVVDACIHAPHTKSGSDERNYHAHIMFTSRQLDKETGDFAKNKFRDFNKDFSSLTVSTWRKDFADLTNQHLEKNGFDERIDHRSHSERELDLEPTIHEGSKVTQLRRQGIDTEISLTNDLIKQRNAEKVQNEQIIKGLDQEIILAARILEKYEGEKDQLAKEERKENEPFAVVLARKELATNKQDLKNKQEELAQIEIEIKALESAEPQEYKMFGFKKNPEHTQWQEKLKELKNNLSASGYMIQYYENNISSTENRISELLETHKTQGLHDSLLSQMTAEQHRYHKILLASLENKEPSQIEKLKNGFFTAYQKDPINFGSHSKQIGYVLSQLKDNEKNTYTLLKQALLEEFKENPTVFNSKLIQLDSAFIKKYLENPNFELPKVPQQEQEQVRRQEELVRGASKSNSDKVR